MSRVIFRSALLLAVMTIADWPEPAGAQGLRSRLQKSREEREAAQREAVDAKSGPLRGGRRGNATPPAGRTVAQINQMAESAAQWVNYLSRTQPANAGGYADLALEPFAQGISAIEYWSAHLAEFGEGEPVDYMLRITDRLLHTKAEIDRQLETAMARRQGFAALQPAEKQNEALAKYLWSTSAYIDLSGRLRYLLFDSLGYVADAALQRPQDYDRLIELVMKYKSGIGAAVISAELFDPAPGETGIPTVGVATRLKILRAIGESGNYELLPGLGELITDPRTAAPVVVGVAEAIERLGIPQDERPGQDPTLPKPPIMAREMADALTRLDTRRLNAEQRQSRDRLIAAASGLAKGGLAGDSYRLGSMEIHPGDWLLMRNPSPYNLFTDLSPGLFTHVGVAAIEKGSDGIRRMVIIDIPERGPEMPATNIDTFVQRTRHFVFLRHPDEATAQAMADAAVATVGNVTEFDLNFRTDRILALKGQPLAGKKIHTYCAGFLYLCALQTDRPREEFFPLAEGPAGGFTASNLAKFGFTFGEDFISPTGTFFSPTLTLVGARKPMYDPGREIEEAVFDHFAESLVAREVTPSPSTFQMLRLKLAEATKDNPLLAKAVASAAGVAGDMDLVAAAKAKALIESLDEVAYGASGEFAEARQAIMMGGVVPPEAKLTAAQQARMSELRTRHAALADRWQKGQLGPRALRIELVKYYIAAGKRRLEERFFASEELVAPTAQRQ